MGVPPDNKIEALPVELPKQFTFVTLTAAVSRAGWLMMPEELAVQLFASVTVIVCVPLLSPVAVAVV